LIKGQNSSVEDAEALAALLNSSLRRGESFPIHVNLIPVNPVKETGLMPPDAAAIKAFSAELERRGVRATVRRTLGPDINASCGQLRRAAAESK
jgi:23S rRNA (adenine2503-C2)-methyltransferase